MNHDYGVKDLGNISAEKKGFQEKLKKLVQSESIPINGKEEDALNKDQLKVPDDILYDAVVLMFNVRFPRRNYMNLTQAFSMGSPWVVGQEFKKIVQNQRVISFMIDKGVIPSDTKIMPDNIVEQLRNTYNTEHNPENDYHD